MRTDHLNKICGNSMRNVTCENAEAIFDANAPERARKAAFAGYFAAVRRACLGVVEAYALERRASGERRDALLEITARHIDGLKTEAAALHLIPLEEGAVRQTAELAASIAWDVRVQRRLARRYGKEAALGKTGAIQKAAGDHDRIQTLIAKSLAAEISRVRAKPMLTERAWFPTVAYAIPSERHINEVRGSLARYSNAHELAYNALLGEMNGGRAFRLVLQSCGECGRRLQEKVRWLGD
ncbi:hypothetical protein HY095_01020 [Candidatus Micrarchaeota archaeon]|nr:hypothetical protein [Candidatus Micrarchaeota archaeon]